MLIRTLIALIAITFLSGCGQKTDLESLSADICKQNSMGSANLQHCKCKIKQLGQNFGVAALQEIKQIDLSDQTEITVFMIKLGTENPEIAAQTAIDQKIACKHFSD